MMDHALNGKVRVDFGPVDGKQANAATVRGPLHLDWLDCALICLFLLGLYTNYTARSRPRCRSRPCRPALPG
jgi:hypothetical protein